MIFVFHLINNAESTIDLEALSLPKLILFSQNNCERYCFVASVDTDNFAFAKQLTTHINCNWWDNKEVKSKESIGLYENARATSTGDVFVKDNCWWVVTKNGFEKMPSEHNFNMEEVMEMLNW